MAAVTDRARIDAYREHIRAEWSASELVAAYRRWGEHEAAWGSAARDLIVDRAQLEPGLQVLDVASGHGEPAVAIATAVGSTGHVTATDQGPGLLEIARERARRTGLDNISFHIADAHELPFLDASFDRVTCRLGAMYFAEPLAAFREARRVLVPGGRATYLVWGRREQPLFDICVGLLLAYVGSPAEEDPDAPNVFAFAEPGSLSARLEQAGFGGVSEEQVTLPSPFPGTPQQYWSWFVDMAPPFTSLIRSLRPDDRERFLTDVYRRLAEYHDGVTVDIPIEVIVASGMR